MPITINISGEAVAEVKQLVHDLSDTMGRMADKDMPVDTAVSTIEQPVAPVYEPQQPTPVWQQQQGYAPPTVPVAPLSVPTAPITQVPPMAAPQQVVGSVPTTAVSYTMEQLGVAAGPLVDAGRSDEILAWINQHGAGFLSQLDKSYYGEFATFLRSLGAKI